MDNLYLKLVVYLNIGKYKYKTINNNTMRKLTPLLLFVFIISCTQQPEKQQPKIRVTGEGKVRVMPDLVILTLNVSFTHPRMADAVRQTQETVDSVMNILSKYAHSSTDIKTSSISANKAYEYSGNANRFVGFKAEQTIDFVLNDISKFTLLTGHLLETKISSISQIQFGHSKADSLFREADLLAYDDAFQSAKKLTKRSESELGKVLFVSNDYRLGEGEQYYSPNSINTYNKGYGGRGFKISPEVLEFRRVISVEYEISN